MPVQEKKQKDPGSISRPRDFLLQTVLLTVPLCNPIIFYAYINISHRSDNSLVSLSECVLC